jgi:hypothetical protein
MELSVFPVRNLDHSVVAKSSTIFSTEPSKNLLTGKIVKHGIVKFNQG